jgi:hypothetical protein
MARRKRGGSTHVPGRQPSGNAADMVTVSAQLAAGILRVAELARSGRPASAALVALD